MVATGPYQIGHHLLHGWGKATKTCGLLFFCDAENISSWNLGGPRRSRESTASIAEGPSHCCNVGTSSKGSCRNKPVLPNSPTILYPMTMCRAWARSGHRRNAVMKATKAGLFIAATCFELGHLTASRCFSKGATASARASTMRRCSAANWGRYSCQTPRASTTYSTSGSGHTFGWKGDGSSVDRMWDSFPRPGGRRWSSPLDESAGNRCPERPEKILALSSDARGVGPNVDHSRPRWRIQAL